MEFHGFILDDFQEKAIKAIQKQNSVVVSAATGTGKTLIAEYMIDQCLRKSGKHVIYTAPIKALSNQKYRDFVNQYGIETIGLLTGDVAINPQAPVLIMTTEIYRNMLLSNDQLILNVEYVIFDEIHFMNDPERGTVWEEAILFSPARTRFLCLSATIPNVNEFSSWMQTLKNHPVETVQFLKRAVPLHHYVFDVHRGLIKRSDLPQFMKWLKQKKRKKKAKKYRPAPAGSVITQVKDKLPALVFSFSRRQCEEEALQLSKRIDFIKDEQLRKQILEQFHSKLSDEIKKLQSTKALLNVLSHGIGFHHAGLLPQQRELVEELFSARSVQVLFATETFSVGVNMPAKTVVLNGIRKFDGRRFRPLRSKEYFQMAGRAGRRGIDTSGMVITIPDQLQLVETIFQISEADREPILSQFQLSFNTVLNMLMMYTDDEIELILKKNFYVYHRKHQQHRQVRMKTSFTKKRKRLITMGYLTADGEILEKGVFASSIYYHELLISELFATGFFMGFSDLELLQIIAGIVYEPKANDYFSFKGIHKTYKILTQKLSANQYVFTHLNKLSLKRMMAIVETWAQGGSFTMILELTNYQEGDVVRLFRRMIDMIQQIMNATQDNKLRDRLSECRKIIDHGLVAVEFNNL
ncbi:MAG: DEAD/DEAH box helicase [Candidatus Thermoplasmatota archaeon]|nr:DEAD/DEAH box helicase [Candidatus Thermoplasmatota archaeon]